MQITSPCGNGASLTLDITPTPTGAMTTCQDIIRVDTNTPGYSLSFRSSSADLNHTSITGQTIPATDNGFTPAQLDLDTWGFAVPSTTNDLSLSDYDTFDATYSQRTNANQSTTTDKYATVPTADTEIKHLETGNYNDDMVVYDDETEVFYGASADMNLTAGQYMTTITYTIIGNEPPEPPETCSPLAFCIEAEDTGTLLLRNIWNGGIIYSVNGGPETECLAAPSTMCTAEAIPVETGDIITVKESIESVSFRAWKGLSQLTNQAGAFIRGIPVKIISMPTMDKFTSDIGGTTAPLGFFANFNGQNGTITSLPAGSFDTSNITTVGNMFFVRFNSFGSLVSLPASSFDTNNIITAGTNYLTGFNTSGNLACSNTSGISIKNASASAVTFACSSGTSLSGTSVASGDTFQYYVSD
jgi:hypothetical protein